jgi:histidine ammonia-lyase
VLQEIGRQPIELEAKEGLALLNGTQASAALAIAGLGQAENLLATSILAGASSVEGLAGSFAPFDSRIHEARGMSGQCRVATLFRALLDDSEVNHSHEDCDRVQDPYAIRCMPQVLGAVRDTLDHAASVLARECNGVSDNPLIFGEDVLSGGNFHAEPLAFVSDFMAIAVAEIGAMSERRTPHQSGSEYVFDGGAGAGVRDDDRPCDGGRSGVGEQDTRAPGVGRQHAHLGRSGRSRQYGAMGGTETVAGLREYRPHPGD